MYQALAADSKGLRLKLKSAAVVECYSVSLKNLEVQNFLFPMSRLEKGIDKLKFPMIESSQRKQVILDLFIFRNRFD